MACVNETPKTPDNCDTQTHIQETQAAINSELALICGNAEPGPQLNCYSFTCTNYGEYLNQVANITYSPPCTDNLMQQLETFIIVCLSDPNNRISIKFGVATEADNPESCPHVFGTTQSACK